MLRDAAIQLLTLAVHICNADQSFYQLLRQLWNADSSNGCIALLKQLTAGTDTQAILWSRWLLTALGEGGEKCEDETQSPSKVQDRLQQRKRHAKQQALLKARALDPCAL